LPTKHTKRREFSEDFYLFRLFRVFRGHHSAAFPFQRFTLQRIIRFRQGYGEAGASEGQSLSSTFQ
jgi:hypothetical protein